MSYVIFEQRNKRCPVLVFQTFNFVKQYELTIKVLVACVHSILNSYDHLCQEVHLDLRQTHEESVRVRQRKRTATTFDIGVVNR